MDRLAILLFLFGGIWECALAAEKVGAWVVSEERDSMTDAITRVASVKNEEGFSLSIYVTEHYKGMTRGRTWLNFSLPDPSAFSLDPNKLIMYRVDDFVPVDTAEALRWEETFPDMEFVEWTPKWLNVSALTLRGGPDYALRQLQRGEELVVRYHLFTGGYVESSFDLHGANESIAKVTGLPNTWDEASERELDVKVKREYLALTDSPERDPVDIARDNASKRCAKAEHPVDVLNCTISKGDCERAHPDTTPESRASLIACLDAVTP